MLGLIVILTAGTFGTINATPWFNLGIAVLFVVLALAMFDVLVIDFSRFSTRFNVGDGGRGTFLVAFGMGAVAALLAGACVAPVVIQVVLFSSNLYASGTALALALPFLLGVGMAIPWPIAGAGIAALPQPGRVDGPHQAGLRRRDSRDSRLLRVPGIRHLREPLGRSRRGGVERRGETQGGLVLVAERRARAPRSASRSRC